MAKKNDEGRKKRISTFEWNRIGMPHHRGAEPHHFQYLESRYIYLKLLNCTSEWNRIGMPHHTILRIGIFVFEIFKELVPPSGIEPGGGPPGWRSSGMPHHRGAEPSIFKIGIFISGIFKEFVPPSGIESGCRTIGVPNHRDAATPSSKSESLYSKYLKNYYLRVESNRDAAPSGCRTIHLQNRNI